MRGHLRKIFGRVLKVYPPIIWNDLKNILYQTNIFPRLNQNYGLLQKTTYSLVIFIFIPLVFMTSIYQRFLLLLQHILLIKVFLGAYQSARTLHLFISIALVLSFWSIPVRFHSIIFGPPSIHLSIPFHSIPSFPFESIHSMGFPFHWESLIFSG